MKNKYEVLFKLAEFKFNIGLGTDEYKILVDLIQDHWPEPPVRVPKPGEIWKYRGGQAEYVLFLGNYEGEVASFIDLNDRHPNTNGINSFGEVDTFTNNMEFVADNWSKWEG